MSAVYRLSFKVIQSCCGATAAEFALVTPVLLTLIFGTFEYGFIAYSMSSMQYGANIVARDVAVNNLDRAAANAAIQTYVPSWMQGKVSMSITEDHPGDARLNSVRIELRALSNEATPLAMVSRLYPWNLTASAIVRQELPYVD